MKRVRTSSSSAQPSKPTVDLPLRAHKCASLDCSSSPTGVFKCDLPPHEPLAFETVASYEAHYAAQHSHRCVECFVNLPSDHFLQLHLSEFHNPFTELRREAGEKTYECFVEGCEKICAEWKKRRLHLIDKHGYPRNYDFLVVRNGIDGRSSLLRPGVDEHGHRRSSRNRSSRQESQESDVAQQGRPAKLTDEMDEEPDHARYKSSSRQDRNRVIPGIMQHGTEGVSVDSMSASMASLSLVPSNITFGRNSARAGFSKT